MASKSSKFNEDDTALFEHHLTPYSIASGRLFLNLEHPVTNQKLSEDDL